jgi:hypothetical protein
VRPWEYTITVQGRTIMMTSPVKWVLCYRSSIGLAQLREVVARKERTRLDELRQTVVNALVLQHFLQRQPGITALLRDLRFELHTESAAEIPGLPIFTIQSCLSSFRPADDLVLAATAFSGVSSFIELIDIESARQPRDTLRENLASILG